MTATRAGAGAAIGAAGRELVITRVFDAPRELVWRAWTECDLLKRWWGPKNFTTPYCKIDLRVGGKYLRCMRSAEGKDYWGTGVYREIARPERLVLTDSFADENGNLGHASHYGFGDDFPADLLVTVTFEELPGGKTRMTMVHSGLPAGEVHEQTGIGWNESLDKMVALVE